VQAATLPSILDNHDVLAQAKTGTGKTLAFLVPSIERLLSGPIPLQSHTSILVLSPTRELAAQIGVAAEGLLGGEKGRFGVRCVVGGTNIETDKRNLKTQR
jgi:ATP-dependent RNA helicase MSS116